MKRKEFAMTSQYIISTQNNTLFFVSVFEWRTGCYVSSMMSNNKESLIKQISEYARLNEQEEIQLRKIIS
jgi:hypothetical protein